MKPLTTSSRRDRGGTAIRTTFTLRCPAELAYLQLEWEDGATQILLMNRSEPDTWRLDLELPPGVYRLRYYVERDGATMYQPPADGSAWEGLDAVLRVSS